MLKIAVVADFLTAEVFSLTDFFVRVVREGDDALRIIEELSGKGFSIIFVTEEIAQGVMEEIKAFEKRSDEAIVVIPGATSQLRLGEKILADLKRKVVGV